MSTSSRARAGKLLRKARRRADKTLLQVARAVGVTVAYVSDVERGTRSVSAERLRAIAKACAMTQDETRAVLRVSGCLPPKVLQHLLKHPEVWGYDLKRVVEALKQAAQHPTQELWRREASDALRQQFPW